MTVASRYDDEKVRERGRIEELRSEKVKFSEERVKMTGWLQGQVANKD